MRNWFIAAAVVALVAANGIRAQEQSTTNTLQHPREHTAARMPEGLLPPRLVDSLSLTDEQKTKLKDIETAFLKEREEWRTANKETVTEMQKLGAEANAARKAGDNAKLEEINKKMQDLRAPVVELRRKYVDQVRTTLTDEQKQKLATALEQMQQHRGGPHPARDAKPTTASPTPKPAE